MSAISVNLEGCYNVTLTHPEGNQTEYQQKNLVLRNGISYLLAGTCVRNLYVGRGITLPSVDETYRMTPVIEATASSYTALVLEDEDGRPYYQHKWTFSIPAGQEISDITELGVGYNVTTDSLTERCYFSRTILRDEQLKLKPIQKREVDTVEIVYTLNVQFEGVDNTAITKMIGAQETTFALGQHNLSDLSAISLNQPLPEGKFFQGYAVTDVSEFKPFAFVDDNIVSISAEQITSVNIGNNQYVSALVRIEDTPSIGRIAVYSRLGVIQYRITPEITLAPTGYIELKINFTLGNK